MVDKASRLVHEPCCLIQKSASRSRLSACALIPRGLQKAHYKAERLGVVTLIALLIWQPARTAGGLGDLHQT